jgi:hypothetical protein
MTLNPNLASVGFDILITSAKSAYFDLKNGLLEFLAGLDISACANAKAVPSSTIDADFFICFSVLFK